MENLEDVLRVRDGPAGSSGSVWLAIVPVLFHEGATGGRVVPWTNFSGDLGQAYGSWGSILSGDHSGATA